MNKLKQLIGESRAIFASVLCLLTCGLLAPSAQAATITNVKYIDAAGNEQTVDAEPVIASNARSTLSAGWCVVEGEVSFPKGVDCSGDVNLILADGAKLTIDGVESGNAGIGVVDGDATLTIYGQTAGTGELTVKGGENGAGIGGAEEEDGSNITINGGKVAAIGGDNAAGIGGGWGGDGHHITINGGYIRAVGKDGGAAIGGGAHHNGGGAGYAITVNGGTIDADEACHAYNLGHGNDGDESIENEVAITGGSVWANGRKQWDSFGLKSPTNAVGKLVYEVTVTNVQSVGRVSITGLDAYGVNDLFAIDNKLKFYLPNGTYRFWSGDMRYDVTVNYAAETAQATETVSVTYIDAAGNEQTTNAIPVAASDSRVTWTADWYVVTNEVTVTGGADCSGAVHLILADTGKLTISGVAHDNAGIKVSGAGNSLAVYGQKLGTGALTVTGGEAGAGIGGCDNGAGSNITINGGVVSASSEYGAGIGGGEYGEGSNITINGGEVIASSYDGAGIGGGGDGAGSNITINGGEVIASSEDGAGIGGGDDGAGSNITINGGNVNATGGDDDTGIGGGFGGVGSCIRINGGAVTATGGEYAEAIGSGCAGDAANNIFAADAVIVKAGNSANPTTEIMHTSTTDLAMINDFMKRYVTTELQLTEPIPSSVTQPANGKAAVYTNGVLSADGIVPSNGVATVVYTANEGYMFKFGQTTITQTLDTTVNPAVATDTNPGDAIVQWVDEREIDIDTRARIVVSSPEEVLPIAYSHDFWGKVTKAEVADIFDHMGKDGQVYLLRDTDATGYVELTSLKEGVYGPHSIVYLPKGGGFLLRESVTNVLLYYSQPYALTVTAPAEGGTITAAANTADAEAGMVLGYDFVDIVAEPTDAKWALKTWNVTTNGVAVQEILTEDVTALTNRFEMPLCDTVLTAEFVIAESYRAELAQAATNDYVAATNDLESLRLNRLSNAETDAALAAAKGALDTAAGALADATKPSEAESATNTLANALADIEDDAAAASDGKPYEFVIASDFSENPPFEDYDPDAGTFTWNGKTWTVGVDAFTSFTDAFTNETYGAFATNLHVFGYQTIASEPPMVDTWNLDLVTYEDGEGNDVSPIVSVSVTDDDPTELVNITNNLGQITGAGDIILGKTSDNVDPSIYADFIAEGAEITVTNTGAEQEKDAASNVIVEVDDRSKAESDPETGATGVILAGVENLDGDCKLIIESAATNDVLVAGTVKVVGDVTIRNKSTNELEIAGAVEAVKVKIDNYGKTSDAEGAIIAKKIIASGDVMIDNAAHLEANVEAGGTITIHNGSPNTIVGMYDGADISISGGKEGAISNVTFVSDGPVTMDGVNVLTGPFAIEAPAGAITNKDTLAWNLRGGNFTTKLADFDAVEFLASSRFQIWVELEQSVGRYVLADNAGSLADKDAFKVEVREGSDAFTVSLGEGYVVSAGAKRLYRLDLDEADALVLTVIDTSTHFDETAYSVPEGGAVKVYVRGGTMEHAVQATLSYVKNTGAYSAAYVNGKKVTFPLTLSWAKGEMGLKEILFQTSASTKAEADKSFTLQLSAPVGEDVVETLDVCTVTITDAKGGAAAKPYVRALAWPANAGTVTGAGELANAKTYRTLAATAKSFATFAGWYKAKAGDPNVIDLTAPVTPYDPRTPKQIRVGYDSKQKKTVNEAGTYFAYFTNVLAVAEVEEPQAFDVAGKPLDGVSGIVAQDGAAGVYETMVGVKFRLPVGFADASGKGKLTITKLPGGLTYDAKRGCIAGVPTKAGTYKAQFVASNAAGKHTVTYVFDVAEMPANAIGSFNGVVCDDIARTGVGSVQFTAGKTGSLSAKVTRRLSGTRSFSVKGYDYVDADTLGVAMTNAYGEVFEATLVLTNDWTATALEGSAFGGVKKGTLGANGETNGTFAAVRNSFKADDRNAEALQRLELYRSTYTAKLFATNELGVATEELGSVEYRVKTDGNVYVVAKIGQATPSPDKSVVQKVIDSASGKKTASTVKTFSGTVTGGFLYDPVRGLGGCAAALRSGTSLWSTEAVFDHSTREVEGQARYIRPDPADKTKALDEDQFVDR